MPCLPSALKSCFSLGRRAAWVLPWLRNTSSAAGTLWPPSGAEPHQNCTDLLGSRRRSTRNRDRRHQLIRIRLLRYGRVWHRDSSTCCSSMPASVFEKWSPTFPPTNSYAYDGDQCLESHAHRRELSGLLCCQLARSESCPRDRAVSQTMRTDTTRSIVQARRRSTCSCAVSPPGTPMIRERYCSWHRAGCERNWEDPRRV